MLTGASATRLDEVGAVADKVDDVVLVRGSQRVRPRALKVSSKRDHVARRTIRRKNETKHLTRRPTRTGIDRGSRAARAGHNAGRTMRRINWQRDRSRERLSGRTVDERRIGPDGQAVNRDVAGNVVRTNLVRANRNRGLAKKVQLGCRNRVGGAREGVAG